MKKSTYYFVLLFLFMAAIGNAQKLVGYLPSYASHTEITAINYQRMTDVIFSFINCDASGNLIKNRIGSAEFDFEMDKFQLTKGYCYPVVDNGPRLWIALGGAGSNRTSRLSSICGSAGTRGTLVNQLVAFAIEHDCYGIDLDWEFPGPGETASLNSLINDLRAAITGSSRPTLKISIAIGGETVGACPAGHMAYFAPNATVINNIDFFHMMVYDLPASYNTNHSTTNDTETALNNWNSCKNIPFNKMVVGIPFYGRNSTRSLAMDYNTIVAGDVATAFANDSYSTGGNTYYHNSGTESTANSVQKKVDVAKKTSYANNTAGVLVWDVSQDRSADASYSLLKALNTKMYGSTSNSPCSELPYIGKDTVKCNGSTVALTSGISTTPGGGVTRTYLWYKDGVSTGITTNAFTVPADIGASSAKYSVLVTQTSTNYYACLLTDTIIVYQVNDVATPVATPSTVCSTGTASSNLVTSGAPTIKWYTSATSGASFATGASVSVSPTTTTTYYVSAQSTPTTRKYYAGRTAIASSGLWNERTKNPSMTPGRPEWVQKIQVLQPITIQTVVVYFKATDTHNPVQLMVLDATLPATSTPVAVTGNLTFSPIGTSEPWGVYPQKLTANLSLQPGTYYIGIYNPDGGGAAPVAEGAGLEIGIGQANAQAGVYSIEANAYQNSGTAYGVSTHYGQLYDWRILSEPPTQCARKSVVVTHDCPAPVQWLRFVGNSSSEGNQLKWATAQEQNNDYFVVERSSDGSVFEFVGKVDAVGNASEISSYDFFDSQAPEGVSFYRLMQVDINGTVDHSKIISINKSEYNSLSVYPNPTQSLLNIQSAITGEYLIVLRTLQGQIVNELTMSGGLATIDLAGLSNGSYVLQVFSGEQVYTYKITKE